MIAAATVIGTSDSFQDCEHQRKHHQPYAALQKKGGVSVDAVTRLELHAACTRLTIADNNDAIIAIFTILLALFTVRLAVATDKLVAGGEDTAQRQLRAYVYPEIFTLVQLREDTFGIRAPVRNFGQTPAYKIRIRVHIAFEPFPYNGHDIGMECSERLAGADVPTGHGTGVTFELFPGAVTRERAAKIASGDLALWAVGSVTYQDTFGKTHWTNFRMFSRGDDWRKRIFATDEAGNDSN